SSPCRAALDSATIVAPRWSAPSAAETSCPTVTSCVMAPFGPLTPTVGVVHHRVANTPHCTNLTHRCLWAELPITTTGCDGSDQMGAMTWPGGGQGYA